MRTGAGLLRWAGAALLCAGAARGQEAAPEPPAEVAAEARPRGELEEWTVLFEPTAWYTSPGGHVELPNSTVGLTRLDKLNLDSPRLTPYGELQVRRGRYGVTASGFAFEMEDRGAIAEESGVIGGVPFSVGERVVTSLEFISAEAAGWYRFYEHPRGARDGGGVALRPVWDVMLGGRVYDIDFAFEAPGGATAENAFFVEPMGGVRFGMDIIETVSIDITGTIGYFTDGGDRTSLSWDIGVGFQWNPTKNIGIQLGYRQLAFRLHDGAEIGDFEFNGAMAGLFVGGLIRF